MGHGLPPRGEAAGLISEGRKGKEGQGQRCGSRDGCGSRTLLEHPRRGVGMAPGRAAGQKSLHRLGRGSGLGAFSPLLYACRGGCWRVPGCHPSSSPCCWQGSSGPTAAVTFYHYFHALPGVCVPVGWGQTLPLGPLLSQSEGCPAGRPTPGCTCPARRGSWSAPASPVSVPRAPG